MAAKKVLAIVREMGRRPSYREYLRYKLLRSLRLAKPDPRWAQLRIPERTKDRAAVRANDSRAAEGASTALAARVRDKLFDRSPYQDFDPQPHPDDMQGWGSNNEILVRAIELLRPARICEVGSWKGQSAIQMARAAKALGLNTEIVCVDTWLGSPEHWLTDPEWYASLRIVNGMPQIYYTFLANIVRAGLTEMITPLPMTSENAAEILSRLGIRFDLVYIDAAHEYAAAKRDIAAYYNLLADDGLLIGDDYISWPGVTRAADEFAAEHGVHTIGLLGKVVIPKGEKYASITLG